MLLDADQIAYLIKVGRETGSVPFSAVREALPYTGLDPESWKQIVEALKSQGVEVEMSDAQIISGRFGPGEEVRGE